MSLSIIFNPGFQICIWNTNILRKWIHFMLFLLNNYYESLCCVAVMKWDKMCDAINCVLNSSFLNTQWLSCIPSVQFGILMSLWCYWNVLSSNCVGNDTNFTVAVPNVSTKIRKINCMFYTIHIVSIAIQETHSIWFRCAKNVNK